jgi:serine/threonine protein kinase
MDNRLTSDQSAQSSRPEPSKLSPGSRFGRYELAGPLGSGGMGQVYRARDTRLGRDVAIKFLSSHLSSNSEDLERFEREARSASALNHPNIVTIFELGEADGTLFIAMELIEGELLRNLLAAGPLSLQRAIPIATQAADGLAKAHEAGVVHRDLKPENLMISHDGFVKILDFGLAKLAALDELSAWSASLTVGRKVPPSGLMLPIPLSWLRSLPPRQPTPQTRIGSPPSRWSTTIFAPRWNG